MSLFIDPLTDFGFKKIFANENHKNITIDFLNSILGLESPIKSIEFGNLEKIGSSSVFFNCHFYDSILLNKV